ncbi:MAG: aconitase X catalytic domain-containing protein, partial [Alphaproteobacteria bacterium]|nr:aconitase X catalytic domain-containing protein [Alphaproteobacteria bacterium]
MKLTAEEEAMLSGAGGEGVRLAAQVMTALGESQGAERFVPIRRAHAICTLDSLACDPALEIQGGLLFLEELVSGGAKSREEVTLTLQPPGIDVQKPTAGGAPEAYAKLQLEILEALIRLGAVPAYSCVPYLDANVPNLGEVVAYGESSVAVYANSMLGARTNRESGPTPICAAIMGRVPEYGLLLDEHRRGQVLVQVSANLADAIDYALLGAHLGEALVDRIPVLEGVPATVSAEELKYLGSCASVTGAHSMFHVAGVTPEAPTTTQAFAGAPPPAELTVSDADLAQVLASLRTFDGPLDMVMLGNPQYTVRELARLAHWLEGRKISRNVELLVCTNSFQ